jgi:hypothetical protein
MEELLAWFLVNWLQEQTNPVWTLPAWDNGHRLSSKDEMTMLQGLSPYTDQRHQTLNILKQSTLNTVPSSGKRIASHAPGDS